MIATRAIDADPWQTLPFGNLRPRADEWTCRIILAAGQGKGMKSEKAKILHEVCGQPMIRYVVDAVRGRSSSWSATRPTRSANGRPRGPWSGSDWDSIGR